MIQFTPTCLVLFGLTFHWYGVIIATGMALAVALACARERRLGLPKDTALDLALLGIPMAIVCLFSGIRFTKALLLVPIPLAMLFIFVCGMSLLLGADVVLCTAVVTATLVGHTMKKPLATVLLLMIVFPLRLIPVMLLAAAAAKFIPTPKILMPKEIAE